MKFLKVLLIIVLIAVIGVVVAGLVLPTNYEVKRTVAIDANQDVVIAQVKSLQNMQTWSPWKDYDPDMEVSYEGVEGEVGSKSSWKGDENVGSGSQELAKVSENRLEFKLDFIEPWEDHCDVYFDFAEADGEVNVTWGIKGNTPFPMNVMGLFMSMDDMMGKDFETGLSRLKAKSEKIDSVSKGYFIETIDFPQTTFFAQREEVAISDLNDYFPKAIPSTFQKAGELQLKFEPIPYGLFRKFDEENNVTDVAIGLAMLDNVENVDANFEEAGGKALKLEYWGGYAGSYEAHMAINDYINATEGIDFGGLVIEKYFTNPQEEPDSNKWHTDIIYMIK